MTPTRDDAVEAAKQVTDACAKWHPDETYGLTESEWKSCQLLARFVLGESPPSPGEGEAEVRKDIDDVRNNPHVFAYAKVKLLASHCESLLAENARLRAELARRDAAGEK